MPLYSTDDGVISRVYPEMENGKMKGFRNRVYVNTFDGNKERITVIYGHLAFKSHLKAKDKVEKGQAIGYVGSTGGSEAPHLHYQIAKGWYGKDWSGIIPDN